jgi:hypothetical protein
VIRGTQKLAAMQRTDIKQPFDFARHFVTVGFELIPSLFPAPHVPGQAPETGHEPRAGWNIKGFSPVDYSECWIVGGRR